MRLAMNLESHGNEELRTNGSRARKLLWRIVLYGHVVIAVMWWWLMPGGFPISNPHFWTNDVLPFIAAGICVACLVPELRRKAIIRATTAATIPTHLRA